MQKNEGLIFSFSDKFVSDFHREMEILPTGTPLFVCDARGKILYKYKFETGKDMPDDISLLPDDDELSFYLSERTKRDCLAVEISKDSDDEFLVLSKTETGLVRGVVCSCRESQSKRLCDYLEKLCSYKDYLSSFSTIAFSDLSELSLMKRLTSRINGAGYLMKLCDYDFLENEEKYDFPIVTAMRKLALFVEGNCDGMSVNVKDFTKETQAVVNIPIRFLRIMVSCMSLAARYSKDGKVDVELFSDNCKEVKINIFALSYVDVKQDVFAKTITRSLNGMGIDVNMFSGGGKYCIEMQLEISEKKSVSLAEEDELMRIVSGLFAETALCDMVYTIAK